MQWSEDFESGLPEIDGHHREMFALIQRVRDGIDRSMVRDILSELAELASGHFASEERLMADFEYPGMRRHATEHASLLREIQGYRDCAAFSPRRLNLVLCNWLMSHTIMADRQLAEYVLRLRAIPHDEATQTEFVIGFEPSPQSEIRSKSGSEARQASG